jgi:hypothetical protein
MPPVISAPAIAVSRRRVSFGALTRQIGATFIRRHPRQHYSASDADDSMRSIAVHDTFTNLRDDDAATASPLSSPTPSRC